MTETVTETKKAGQFSGGGIWCISTLYVPGKTDQPTSGVNRYNTWKCRGEGGIGGAPR